MKKQIRIVAVDDNEAVLKNVKSYFKDNCNISVVASFNDGKKALDYLVDNKDEYDLVLLDIILAHCDGLKILEEMKYNKLNKKIMVISSFKDDFTIKRAQMLGASYYMLKPIDMEVIEKRVDDLFAHQTNIRKTESNKMELQVSTLLHDLGIPSHVLGYGYIREGIMILYANETTKLITKDLYPNIARKYNTTSSRVERAIRHAIEISWARGDLKLMEEIFGNSIDFERSKPTNAEFLTTIADRFKVNDRVMMA